MVACTVQVVVKYVRLIGAEKKFFFSVIECHCEGAIQHVYERHWHFVA